MKKENSQSHAKTGVPPYIPYKTFRNFIGSLQQGVPSRIDRSLMGTMSGGLQQQLLAALKYLRLITEKGGSTEQLTRLVKSEGAERQKNLTEILQSSFPFLFRKEFDLENATAHQLEDEFKNVGAGGGTIRKCVKFFIEAAKDAHIAISPYILKAKHGTKNSVVKSKPKKRKTFKRTPESEPSPPEQSKQVEWPQLLLSKFPSFDPDWSDEVKAKWFDAFDQLMKRGEKESAENE
ncbi:MAG: DUF5343 domain-containing protein [Thermodesulfobacteriota bacterium]